MKLRFESTVGVHALACGGKAAPASRDSSGLRLLSGVAQVSKVAVRKDLYRRFPIGGTLQARYRLKVREARRLEACDTAGWKPALLSRQPQRGVALVITLIMLAVITVMAVAFLSITRRERAAVANASEYTDAQHVAGSGEERAKAEVIAQILAQTNWNAVDLMVSQNFINTNGFFPGSIYLTNVNYDYTFGGGPLSDDDWKQNIANLWIDPRVPVFINTNRAGTAGPLDFRFFVDLNRNGRFDTNGYFIPYDEQGKPIPDVEPELHVGDLEWIGVLERGHLPHSSSNRFFGRYAFIVVPVGKTLDLNFIHNDGKRMMGTATPGTDYGFYRNQGFGSWEVNLAGFLNHLNTNEWPANPQFPDYDTNLNSSSRGIAFHDATDLLRFRYNLRYQNLYSARDLLQEAVWSGFRDDHIDGYLFAPNPPNGGALVTDFDNELQPWPGACSTESNHFFSVHDLFLSPQTSTRPYPNFMNKLAAAASRNNSYDRHTVTRLLAQIGTDSAPEPEWADIPGLIRKISADRSGDYPAEPIGRININWDNILLTNDILLTGTKRRWPLDRPWEALKFFTNTANVLLRSRFDFGATNIPVYPTNSYTPEVHRMLQMAANIYDATSTDPLPFVYRPIVTQRGTAAGGEPIMEITGFEDGRDVNGVAAFLQQNTFGLPMIVGAKKGIPNFNEYVVQTTALAARKLELIRPDTNSPPNQTNDMFVLGISNYFAVEAWNSYSNAVISNVPISQLTTQLTMVANNVVGLTVTNSDGLYYTANYAFINVTNVHPQYWSGFQVRQLAGGFIVPVATNVMLLTNSVYRMNPSPRFEPVRENAFERDKEFHVPEWHITLSNRVWYLLHNKERILDFVYLDQMTNTVNLNETLLGMPPGVAQAGPTVVADCWNTNRVAPAQQSNTEAPTMGIIRQLLISRGEPEISQADWNDFNYGGQARSFQQIRAEIASFRSFLGLQPLWSSPIVENTNLVVQAPFSPARKFVQTVSWQANDPIVHHRVEHLKDITNNITTIFIKPVFSPATVSINISNLNYRYRPWNGNPKKADHPNDNNLAVKDPGIMGSDGWDFPTNKLPSIGWLGRVHRGTPWQTVYLKADVAAQESWVQQFLDLNSHPTNDWKLIDMFTVAPHPNATRGQLSINQTNIASWSAVLSGVFVLTNGPAGDPLELQLGGVRTNLFDHVIDPASIEFLTIVDGINRTRAELPDKTFRRLGDILQVPELSVGKRVDPTSQQPVPVLSPYLRHRDDADIFYGLTDTAYERIPQQILSLLKVGDPRYVIYAFGQSLKPADRSIITSGGAPYFGMCTNYQVTAEVVTRSVVRMEGPISRPRAVIEAFNILPID
jgi:hypothetical protein